MKSFIYKFFIENKTTVSCTSETSWTLGWFLETLGNRDFWKSLETFGSGKLWCNYAQVLHTYSCGILGVLFLSICKVSHNFIQTILSCIVQAAFIKEIHYIIQFVSCFSYNLIFVIPEGPVEIMCGSGFLSSNAPWYVFQKSLLASTCWLWLIIKLCTDKDNIAVFCL